MHPRGMHYQRKGHPMQDPQKHLRTCNLCEAMCGIEITHEQGRILSIKGDPHDPLSKGHICPKAVALQDLHEDPDRLRYPLRSEEHTSELQSRENLVCRLLLEKK